MYSMNGGLQPSSAGEGFRWHATKILAASLKPVSLLSINPLGL